MIEITQDAINFLDLYLPQLGNNKIIVDILSCVHPLQVLNYDNIIGCKFLAYACAMLYEEDVMQIDLEAVCAASSLLIKRSTYYLYSMWVHRQTPLSHEDRYIIPLLSKLTKINLDSVLFIAWMVSQMNHHYLEILSQFTSGYSHLSNLLAPDELASCRKLIKHRGNAYVHILLQACYEFATWESFILTAEEHDIPSTDNLDQIIKSPWFVLVCNVPLFLHYF